MLDLPEYPRILADSINWTKNRLTTFLVVMPTCLLAELRTHRLLKWSDSDFSINANSDRAIPISTKIEHILEKPYIPIPSLANKGMTAIELVPDDMRNTAKCLYLQSMNNSIEIAKELLKLGFSKQYVNRLLMPYSFSYVVITGDNMAWEHFFNLRTNKDVEPNFRYIAILMQELYSRSFTTYLKQYEWHIPFKEEAYIYARDVGNNKIEVPLGDTLKVSGSCCARISYKIQRNETLAKHVDRFDNCVKSGHISIAEHQARVPSIFEHYFSNKYSSNVNGWVLLRKILEIE